VFEVVQNRNVVAADCILITLPPLNSDF